MHQRLNGFILCTILGTFSFKRLFQGHYQSDSLSGLIWVQTVGNGYTFNPWMTKVAASQQLFAYWGFLLPLIFSKSTFFEKFFQEYHQRLRMSKSLDPDQTRCIVRPDLGPNCLGRQHYTYIYLRNLLTHTVNNLLQTLNYVESIHFFVV